MKCRCNFQRPVFHTFQFLAVQLAFVHVFEENVVYSLHLQAAEHYVTADKNNELLMRMTAKSMMAINDDGHNIDHDSCNEIRHLDIS